MYNLKIKIMSKFSFLKGFNQVKRKDIAKVKRELMETLQITTRPAWDSRLKGKVEPRVSEAEAIESVFSKYGIKEVWGV